MAKFDITTDDGRESLEKSLNEGGNIEAYLCGMYFSISKKGLVYKASYNSIETGPIKASGDSLIESINKVCDLMDLKLARN